ncbi:MAG: PilN domain-containing protein [Cellulomonas sp.]
MAQVDLMPPEVRAARVAGSVKRWLAIGLAALVVVVGCGIGLAAMDASAAQDDLSKAQANTDALVSQQAQFADVPVVLDRLDKLTNARKLGMSTEVRWQPYIFAIFAVMPQGVQLGSIDTVGATPMVMPAAPANPLQLASVDTITFTGRSKSAPDTAGWVDALNSIPGFQDAWVSVIETKEDSDDGVYYAVQSTVQVTTQAYANRFAEPKGN